MKEIWARQFDNSPRTSKNLGERVEWLRFIHKVVGLCEERGIPPTFTGDGIKITFEHKPYAEVYHRNGKIIARVYLNTEGRTAEIVLYDPTYLTIFKEVEANQ